jgi:hypothetical protein
MQVSILQLATRHCIFIVDMLQCCGHRDDADAKEPGRSRTQDAHVGAKELDTNVHENHQEKLGQDYEAYNGVEMDLQTRGAWAASALGGLLSRLLCDSSILKLGYGADNDLKKVK